MNSTKSLPSLLLIFGVCFGPGAASAQTTVASGVLSTSQTWTAAGSPYIVLGDLTVPTGVTLTLSAGTVVHLGPGDDQAANVDLNRTELRIAGTLNVNGFAGNPVLVRSGASSPAPSDYYGFFFLPGATVAGAYLHMEHAGVAVSNEASGTSLNEISLRNSSYGLRQAAGTLALIGGEILDATDEGVLVVGGTLSASDIRVANSIGNGVQIYGGDVTLDHSHITGNSDGIVVTNTATPHTVLVDHASIYGNQARGVLVTNGSTAFTLRNTLIIDNDYGISGAQISQAANLVWGNRINYNSQATPSSDSLSENPLLVDLAGGDIRPTSNSGLRLAGTDGLDIGAEAYDGVPTVGLLGHLFANTVLTAAASPHLVTGDLTVEPGIRLTIEPGAEVRFSASADQMDAGTDANLTELRVDGGRLVADGTVGAPILFTATANAPGAWYGIHQLSASAGASIDHATIEFGRYGVDSDTASLTVVQHTIVRDCSVDGLNFTGPATLNELRVRDNAGQGIFLGTRGSALTRSLVFDNGGNGVTASNAGIGSGNSITNNTIARNGGAGVYITGPSSLAATVRSNILFRNSYGIRRSSGSGLSAAYNLVWRNDTNYGAPPGSRDLNENPLFVNSLASDSRIGSRSPARQHGAAGVDIGAIPFDGTLTPQVVGHLYEDTVLNASASPHRVIGDLTVEPGVTLTIEPGAELRFVAGADHMEAGVDPGRAELRVLGTLVADGTNSRRINITSDAVSPARGDWYGVHLITGANSLLDFVTVEYAYHAVHSSAPSGTVVQRSTLRQSGSYGLYVDGGAASYDQLIVRDGGDHGVRVDDATGSLTKSQVFDNTGYGISIGNVSGGRNFDIVGNTIVDNDGHGVSIIADSRLTVIIRDNIISSNRGTGIYVRSSVVGVESHNLLWRNYSAYSGINRSPTSPSENPLFANRPANDFRITSRSRARFAGSTGGDLGALPFDGVTTIGEMGHLYVDTTWALSASPIMVLGTITVEPGVTLTVEAGVDVRVASIDAVGGSSNGATQIRIAGRLLVNGAPGARVTIRSASLPMYAFSGEWSGITLLNSAANSLVQHAHILHAVNGIESYASATNVVRDCEFETALSAGINVRAGDMTFDRIYVHDSDNLGIAVSGGTPTFNNLVVTRVVGDGVVTTGDVTINHATLDNCGAAGIEVLGNAPCTINVTNSSITNNAFYGVSSVRIVDAEG